MADFVYDNVALPASKVPDIRPVPVGQESSYWGKTDANAVFDALTSLRGHAQGWVNVKSPKFGAKGDGVTDDTAAIQAAINATPAGGTLLIPASSGNYVVGAGLPLLVTKSINIIGQSGSTIGANSALQVSSSTSASTDVFLVQPATSQVVSVLFRDMAILPQSGAPGRYAINFDGTNGAVNQTVIDHVYFGTFGTANLHGFGNGLANGTPAASLIWRSYLQGGSAGAISFPNAGDSVKIRDCTIVGPGPALDVGFFAGAALMELQGNYILSDGGIHIGGTATAVVVWGNEIQTQGTFTGSNGAVIDIDGTVGSHAVDTIIGANSFQVVNGITANAIRVNFADRTQIFGNRFGRGAATSKDILVTANATETMIWGNSYPNGGPFTSMVSDSGTRTTFFGPYPGSNIWVVPANKGIDSLDDTGTARAMLLTNSSDGSVQLNGYHAQGAALLSVNGATFLYDSNGNLGLVVSGAVSTVPSATAVATVQALAIRGGINNDQGGFKHKRLTTGSIAANTDVDVTVTWTTAFADANYTVVASVVDATASNLSLKVVHITSVAAASCVVRVRNDSAGALTGTLHVHAIHD